MYVNLLSYFWTSNFFLNVTISVMSYVIGLWNMTHHRPLLISHNDQYCSIQAARAVK